MLVCVIFSSKYGHFWLQNTNINPDIQETNNPTWGLHYTKPKVSNCHMMCKSTKNEITPADLCKLTRTKWAHICLILTHCYHRYWHIVVNWSLSSLVFVWLIFPHCSLVWGKHVGAHRSERARTILMTPCWILWGHRGEQRSLIFWLVNKMYVYVFERTPAWVTKTKRQKHSLFSRETRRLNPLKVTLTQKTFKTTSAKLGDKTKRRKRERGVCVICKGSVQQAKVTPWKSGRCSCFHGLTRLNEILIGGRTQW